MDAMKMLTIIKLTCCLAIFFGGSLILRAENETGETPATPVSAADVDTPDTSPVIQDSQIQLCQGLDSGTTGCSAGCQGNCNCDGAAGAVSAGGSFVIAGAEEGPVKCIRGVNQSSPTNRREKHWRNSQPVPWEYLAYGEYIGPFRTPHVSEYRLRVDDTLEFVYLLTREKMVEPYRLYVGDVIQVTSAIDATLNQTAIGILPDGTISLALIGQVRAAGKTVVDLQRELNDRYKKFVKNPSIVVQVTASETPLQDLLNSVDARFGQGGQGRQAIVSPDGTIQLPLIGSVPAIGLSLNEIGREVNARYRQRLPGIGVTPILTQRAPRFIYVVGEVTQAGRYELTGPTSAMQGVALAGGFNPGGNIRQVIVFRRDQNWRLTATKLDLAAALYGKSPYPSDEIWLRDSDIVLIPKKPIQRLSEAVNQYFTETIYGIFPSELGSFDAASVVN
jgi:polysaccharide export outer membrane protein